MGTLTSTISISGTLNGRKVDVTSVMTLENVYDGGIAQPFDNQVSDTIIGMGTPKPIQFAQNCPSYLFMANQSVSETGVAQLTNTGGAVDYQFVLSPKQFLVLNEPENGLGMITIDNNATAITLQHVQAVQFDKIPDIGFVIKGDAFVAFEAAS